MRIHVLLCTAPPDRADGIARALVESRLVACVNVIPRVVSTYRWKGDVCVDDESLLVIKTRGDRFAEVNARLRTLHPYEVYELVALPVDEANPPYAAWVEQQSDGGDA